MSRHNSYKLSLKNYLYNTDFLNNKTDTKSRPQWLHSYRLNLSLLRTLRWSGESRIPITLIGMQKGGIPSCWCAMLGVQRNIFIRLESTADSIKIFSITFCTLVNVFCTCKIAKDQVQFCTKRVALSYTLYWQMVALFTYLAVYNFASLLNTVNALSF